jgi:hypothetical protein
VAPEKCMRSFVALVAILTCSASLVSAQATPPSAAPAPGSRTIKLFLDCNSCDGTYIRQEMQFVDHVRNREDADVHVLGTTRSTGSGGTEWTLKFIGLGPFKGVDDELVFTTAQIDSSDTRRRMVAHMLRLGLARYLAHSQLAKDVQLTYRPPAAQQQAGAAASRDPWNFWVFRVRLNGGIDGESRSKESSIESSVSANRTTDRWKFNIYGSQDYSQDTYTFSDGSSYLSVRRSYEVEGLLVKSLTPHWSAGLLAGVSSSTYYNQDLAGYAAPAVEYNIYPYAESTRRQLTFRYAVGYRFYDYMEETLFGKMSEHLLQQSLRASYDTRQPWGSMSADVELLQFLQMPSKNSLDASAEVDIRLFKGFSLNLDGGASRVRDQLYLARGEASNEEVLVRQRKLATSYQYSFSFGISYQFGSIFNNIVNTRISS